MEKTFGMTNTGKFGHQVLCFSTFIVIQKTIDITQRTNHEDRNRILSNVCSCSSGVWTDLYVISAYRSAWNAIIQGGAFEIVKRSMLLLEDAGFDIRNQVHDSVWLMVPVLSAKEKIAEAEEIMSGWTEEAFGLKFSVDSKRLA